MAAERWKPSDSLKFVESVELLHEVKGVVIHYASDHKKVHRATRATAKAKAKELSKQMHAETAKHKNLIDKIFSRLIDEGSLLLL